MGKQAGSIGAKAGTRPERWEKQAGAKGKAGRNEGKSRPERGVRDDGKMNETGQ
jgi:hypothetical protein